MALALSFMLGSAVVRAEPPQIDALLPAGGQRGTEVSLQLVGKLEDGPVEVWTHSGAIRGERENPKEDRLRLAIGEDAIPGVHWLRLATAEGASKLLPFVVGTVPEFSEDGLNRGDANRPADLPPLADLRGACIVNGRLAERAEVDRYRLHLDAGQQLLLSLHAHRDLGSPMDGVLQLVGPEGTVLEQNDDWAGLDPRIDWRVPAAGEYQLRIFAFPETPNSSIEFAGEADFVYRLAISTIGAVDSAWPLAVDSAQREVLQALGPQLEPVAFTVAQISSDGQRPDHLRLFHEGMPGWAEATLTAQPAAWESDDTTLNKPLECPWPASITGRLEAGDQEDAYQLMCQEGDRVRVSVTARQLHFPLDALLEVRSPEGKQLGEDDDSGQSRDARLSFTAKTAGAYKIVVRDRFATGGPRHWYRLDLQRVEPSFSLSVPASQVAAPAGKPLSIEVDVTRRDGLDQPIRVEAVDLPEGVEGGVVVSEPKGDSAKKVTLVLNSEQPCHGSFAVVGTVEPGPARVVRVVAEVPEGTEDADAPRLMWLTFTP